MSNQLPAPNRMSEVVAKAKYKRWLSSEERKDGGPGFWIISQRPFDEVATDLMRSALRACKPTPSVLGNTRR